jgi:glucose dehydrogenase
MLYRGNYRMWRYSGLNQIKSNNIKRLAVS